MKKKNSIKRADYDRVLVTETLPYETPIIFSNDGLYHNIQSAASGNSIHKTLVHALIFGEGIPTNINSTIPYSYKIRKNSIEFRRLSLIHPMSQWKMKIFYEKYEALILHHCDSSTASIRAPRAVAGSFYEKSSWENISQYKTGKVAMSSVDRYVKHSPSYFSYRGFDRLYKFFNSQDYFSLEKKFSVLMTLDVSKCFDSIYTHCLSWAVKDKSFTKEHVSISSTFAQEFDQVVRHGNHNETNGIPIGPEFSRIFAEILFQEIDRRSIEKIKKKAEIGVDYELRRYVDDVFIFSTNEDSARIIYSAYADILISFNLHANAAKSSILARPFLTEKSRLIYEAGRNANDFFEKFLSSESHGKLTPKPIFRSWKLTKSYIDSIKALCAQSKSSYDDLSSFLIAVIAERIKRVVNTDLNSASTEEKKAYLSALEVLLDVLFFLYSVAPSVGASYKLATALILSLRFARRHLAASSASLSQRIYDLALSLLRDQCGKSHGEGVDGFIHLECLNIVLAIRELGDKHLLPEKIFDDLFVGERQLSYFTIVSCLFYMRSDPLYDRVRKKIMDAINLQLADFSDILMNSEKTYLFLDMLSCPHVLIKTKSAWIRKLYGALKKPPPSTSDMAAFLTAANPKSWHVEWNEVDLLNSLEKKELKQAY